MGTIFVRVRQIIIKDTRVLLYYDSEKDYYFFPGGHLEYGETVAEGLERETKEELGENCVFTPIKLLYVRDLIEKEKEKQSVELFFLGQVNLDQELEKRPDPQFEGKKWPTWVQINQIPTNLRPEGLRKILYEDYKTGFLKDGVYLKGV